MHVKRFPESIRKRAAEVPTNVDSVRTVTTLDNKPPPGSALCEHHHILSQRHGDVVITPSVTVPHIPPLPTQNVTIFQMLQEFDEFESWSKQNILLHPNILQWGICFANFNATNVDGGILFYSWKFIIHFGKTMDLNFGPHRKMWLSRYRILIRILAIIIICSKIKILSSKLQCHFKSLRKTM